MKYLLGIDLGTTAIKVAIFDENGKKVGDSTQEYTLITPTPLIVEQRPEVYWDAFKAGLAESLTRSGIAPKDIAALSVSAQGETLLPVDAQGTPLRNAIVWMDNRAQEEAELLREQFPDKLLHRITGQVSMVATWPAAKLLWLKHHEPQIFDAADKFLLIEDWFFHRLSGGFYGEGSLWCSSAMWDLNTKQYWPEMLAYLGIGEARLPQIVEPGTLLGTLLPETATELGLRPETKVVMGALDQACGAIGVGNVRPGIFSESTGAALAVCAVSDTPVFDPNGEMPCFYFGIPNKYMVHTFSSGGIVFKWLRDTLCAEECSVASRCGKDGYLLMDMQAEKIPAGSDGLVILPHFQGAGAPDTDQKAKGVIYGLALNHTKGHIIRAFMESIAMAMCRMLDATTAAGAHFTEIRSLSGGAKSPIWCQIKADAAGLPVRTMKNTADAACLGAAVLAGVAIGLWPSVEVALDGIAQEDKLYLPNVANAAAYRALYARYRELTAALCSFHK